ncbi:MULTISPECIES: Nif3-like dinuclear metal center hexameric protein [unclassified Leucobacter]|uniref:Nif3-like dinuclear metal center hexameric protein n=1 Tax=unclassified Leucobacter TaxID=2621730 RepID=UPI00165E61A4|nr:MULTISPECIES: Nif3-like dinuclear metal center hexameric protein [unclassified Leucobacter]MBC9926767.1 Nif3-like dinuclear metal center hexameric protein [Leucobacter sp. cx-169]
MTDLAQAAEAAPVTVADLRRIAERFWPAATAEGWDRVGLVTGRDAAPLRRVLLAVDAVRATVDEAVEWDADALLVHHPLLLRGVHTIAEDTAKGALLASLIRADCALLAAHTNADAPEGGVSDVLARALGLHHSVPLEPGADQASGIGRVGELPAAISLREFAERAHRILPETAGGVRVAGDPDRMVRRIALCGGAGDSLLEHPLVRGADVYLTSDLRHHPVQESLEQSVVLGGPALVDVSHWASESLWLRGAAERLAAHLPGVEFRVSGRRTDAWTFTVGRAA